MKRPAPNRVAHTDAFALLRIGAALAVVLDHSFLLLGNESPPVLVWHDRLLRTGNLAVLCFFAVSGYLVTESWLRRPDLAAYLTKRALRLLPGLVTVIVMTTLMLGPLMTNKSRSAYFADPLTWRYLRTVTLAPIQLFLPGVFTHNPDLRVNFSLWTLPVEVMAYSVIAIGGFAGVLRRRWPVAFTAVALLVLGEVSPPLMTLTMLVAVFLFGSTMRVYGVRPRGAGAIVAVGVVGLSLLMNAYVLFPPAFVYLMIFLGTRSVPWAARVYRLGDPSYGMYIYGWPSQQTLVAAGVGASPVLFVGGALAATALGYLSWHLVERPCMAAGRRRLAGARARPRLPRAQPLASLPS